jgi:hypothetical protein
VFEDEEPLLPPKGSSKGILGEFRKRFSLWKNVTPTLHRFSIARLKEMESDPCKSFVDRDGPKLHLISCRLEELANLRNLAQNLLQTLKNVRLDVQIDPLEVGIAKQVRPE